MHARPATNGSREYTSSPGRTTPPARRIGRWLASLPARGQTRADVLFRSAKRSRVTLRTACTLDTY